MPNCQFFFTLHSVYVDCVITEIHTHLFGNLPQNTMVIFKMCDSVPSERYPSVCIVLHLQRFLLIPTYRVYLLYDIYFCYLLQFESNILYTLEMVLLYSLFDTSKFLGTGLIQVDKTCMQLNFNLNILKETYNIIHHGHLQWYPAFYCTQEKVVLMPPLCQGQDLAPLVHSVSCILQNPSTHQINIGI